MKVTIPGTTFQRDTKSMALLQSDRKSADDYHLKRKLISANKGAAEDINNMKEEIQSIRSDLDEIKQLLKGLAK